jgi:myo-inositol 2-dehydrogenase / D-chiro-inositol 1-dehydrogenase
MVSVAMSDVRVGVLGCGRIGKMHAELLARQVSGATVTRVFDVFGDAAAAVGADLGVPVSATAQELIESPDVDAVAICTSTDTHVELMVAAARAGKAIFCEKPISLDLAAVDAALAVVSSAGVPFQIGFNRRWDPSHASVAAAVGNGSIGDVHLVRITSRDPAPPPVAYVKVSGGIFLDMTIHDFDMARFVTGSEVVEVFATGAVRVDPAIGEAGDLDTVVIVLTHENGCITTIDNSRKAVYGYDQRVEAFGSLGMAQSNNPTSHTGTIHTDQGTTAATIPYFFLDRYIPSYVREWEAFAAMMRDETPSPVPAEAGRQPLIIGLAALKSVREGRPVRTSEITGS